MLFFYLKIVYLTSCWQFIFPDQDSKQKFSTQRGVIFAFWHNRLAFGLRIFQDLSNEHLYALISAHSDGQIIASIVRKFNHGRIISGSTNKNPIGALKEIIGKLKQGNNIVITPDGPRGPVYEINSSICKVAHRYNIPLIPISCSTSRYFLLKSWDKLIMPLPFGKVIVRIGKPLILTGDNKLDNNNLKQALVLLE